MSLQRRTALRSKQTILRKTRLSPQSPKRKVESKEYAKLREEFLTKHPTCEICGSRKSEDVHHKHGRTGGAYLDVTTWTASCRRCHDDVHRNPSLARQAGWLK